MALTRVVGRHLCVPEGEHVEDGLADGVEGPVDGEVGPLARRTVLLCQVAVDPATHHLQSGLYQADGREGGRQGYTAHHPAANHLQSGLHQAESRDGGRARGRVRVTQCTANKYNYK